MSAVSGVPELDKLFRELSKGMANRIARPGLAKAGRLAARRIKAAVPSRLKDIRKLVKSKSIKTKANGGFAAVKIGPAVGSKKKGKGAIKPRTKRGVGISARNVHWFFTGTSDRRTGFKTRRRRLKTGGSVVVSRTRNNNAVRFTGKMKSQMPGVTKILNSARSEMVALMRAGIEAGIEKEAARLAKKRL